MTWFKVGGATRVTKAMLAASANAVGGQVDVSAPGTHSRKVVENLRALSAIVTEAVCAAAVADGVTTVTHGDVAAAIQRVMWMPEYRSVQPCSTTPFTPATGLHRRSRIVRSASTSPG